MSVLKKTFLTLSAGLVLSAGQALAYDAGDMIVRGGAASVVPNDDSSALNLVGTGELPSTGVSVDDDTQLMLTFTYMVNSHWGLELLASTPFEHDIDTEGLGGLDLGLTDINLGSVEHLPPTLSIVWYPLESSSGFQPYIGAGVNYWLVLDENLSGTASSALGASNLKLDDSAGLAVRAGFDYKLNESWSFNAGLWYIDISTDASVDTALGTITVDVDVDPMVYGIGVGYHF